MRQVNWETCLSQLLATVPPKVYGPSPNWDLFIYHLVGTIVYTIVGLVFFFLSFYVIRRFVPFSIAKEIEEDQNVALAVIIGSIFLGIAIIVAAAIVG